MSIKLNVTNEELFCVSSVNWNRPFKFYSYYMLMHYILKIIAKIIYRCRMMGVHKFSKNLGAISKF